MQTTQTQRPEPVRLSKHTQVSRTTIHGWPSFIFGLPFFGIGGLLIYLWATDAHVGKMNAPFWMMGVMGAMFFVPGVLMMAHGLDGVRRTRRIDMEKKRRPASPWLWDYPWEALGYSENKLKEALQTVFQLVIFGGFLIPFNWWAFYSGEGPFMVQLIVGGMDLLIGVGIGTNMYQKWARYFKFGDSRLRYDSFPFFLGETCALTLVGLPADAEKVEVLLRFVEERYEVSGTGKNRTARVNLYQIYHERREFQAGAIPDRERFAMQWFLPADPELSTSLSERPARYWELEVKAETPGVDYHSQFMVPVYNKDGRTPPRKPTGTYTD